MNQLTGILQTVCIVTKLLTIYPYLLPRYKAKLSQGTFNTFRIRYRIKYNG